MAESPSLEEMLRRIRLGERSALVVLWIPSNNRQNEPLGSPTQIEWMEKALHLFRDQFGGATSFPAVAGVFKTSRGKNLWDKPILVETLTDPQNLLDPKKIRTVRDFCRRMKRTLDQDSVMLKVDEVVFYI